jgi:hypothetical protein
MIKVSHHPSAARIEAAIDQLISKIPYVKTAKMKEL